MNNSPLVGKPPSAKRGNETVDIVVILTPGILFIIPTAPFNKFINPLIEFSTKEKAWDMLNWVADQGVTYFAFNPRIQACAKNHGYYGKICPVCGGKTVTEYTRIVGFFVSVRTYSEERKKEYALRQWEGEEK